MSDTIIAKNSTGSPVTIEDLGIEIPGSGQRTLSDTFDFNEICTAEDLKTLVNATTIIINDGTSDLDSTEGLYALECRTEVEVPPHGLNDHIDVSIDPQDQQKLAYDSTAMMWLGLLPQSSSATPPDDPGDGDLWYPEGELNLPYMWSQGEWITVFRNFLTFSKGGNCDGEYLTIGGWVSADFYFFPRPARITSVYCRVTDGDLNKRFYIYDGNTEPETELYTFVLDGSTYIFRDVNLNVPVDSDVLIKCYCSKDGSLVKDVVVQMQVAWRYVAP